MSTLRSLYSCALCVLCLVAATFTATAQIPGITVTPTTLDFLQVQGGKFAIRSFTIVNTSATTRLTGSVESPGGTFQILSGDGSFDLGPGEAQIVSLRFTPSSHLLFEDSIAITHDATGTASPIWVHVRGSGDSTSLGGGERDSVSLMVSPSIVNFGSVKIGTTAERAVMIRNTSSQAQLVGSLDMSLNGSFMVTSGGGPFMLNPGESRVVTVRFTPTLEGTVEDSLTLNYNGTSASNMATVSLRGTGYVSTTGGGNGGNDSLRLAFIPGSQMLNFGTVIVGQAGVRNVTIMNQSDSLQAIGMVNAFGSVGPFTVNNGAGAFVLAPGQSRTISVGFAPTVSGMISDSFQVITTQNGLPVPTTIYVEGNGLSVGSPGSGSNALVIEPVGPINFGSLMVGHSGQQMVTIRNTSATATLDGTVSNPAAPFFTLGGSGTFSLAPGASLPVFLNYTPTFGGTFSDNLVVTYMDGDSTVTMFTTLNGNATLEVSAIDDDIVLKGMNDALLAQNYPNPFNSSTRIEFNNPATDRVTLQVYNVQGEVVATLVDAELPAGDHAVVMEANGLETGVYMYRLETGPVSVTKRLTIVR